RSRTAVPPWSVPTVVARARARTRAHAGEPGLPRPEVVDDRLRLRRPDPRHPEGHDLEQRVERADTAGGLDLDVGRRVRTHEPQVVVGRAARREAGRSLHEVGAGSLREVAGADL